MNGGTPAHELTIWNWTTGEVILVNHLVRRGRHFPDHSQMRSSLEIATFAFLDCRFLLVGGTVDINNGDARPCLYVLDMAQSSGEKIDLRADYLCMFSWPKLSAWSLPMAFSIRSDPSPAWQPSPETQLPFSIAHQHRIFVITSWVVAANGRQSCYDLFVSADTLLSHIEALPMPQCDIDWDEWGPTGTRLMRTPSPSNAWVCYVFGTKFVTVAASRPRQHPDTLEVRDFNQLAMKRAAESSKNMASQEGTPRHVYDSSVIRAGAFLNDVHTSLPYQVTKRTLPRPFTQQFLTAAMCSEDNLILVYVRMHRAGHVENFPNSMSSAV
jgi:hypothetical protein